MAGRADLQELRTKFDRADMLGRVLAFPEQMTDAWERGGRFAAGLGTIRASRVVLCGMGGSAIGGDLVRSFFGDRLEVPLVVNRGYTVPSPVVRDAMFVFSSYSGNTAETLSAYDAVAGRGAGAVAITSGGELAKRCRRDGVPVCEIPGGMPPRSAIAYSFFPLLRILSAAGLAPAAPQDSFDRALTAVRDIVEQFGPDKPESEAARLAHALYGGLPVVYASDGGLFEGVSLRWSCQFNENGKVVAHRALFTELCHNEIVGWTRTPGSPPRAVVLVLEDEDDDPRVKRQAEVATPIVERIANVLPVKGIHGERLQRILRAVLLGDFASVYLAYLNGVDPTPVENIDHLKAELGSDATGRT